MQDPHLVTALSHITLYFVESARTSVYEVPNKFDCIKETKIVPLNLTIYENVKVIAIDAINPY